MPKSAYFELIGQKEDLLNRFRQIQNVFQHILAGKEQLSQFLKPKIWATRITVKHKILIYKNRRL